MPSYVAVLKFNSNHDQTGRFAAGKSKGGTLHFRKSPGKAKAQGGLFDLLDMLRGKKTPKPKLGPVVKIK
jgi:hypothetical protein